MKELYEELRQENKQEPETPKVQISLEDAMKDLGLDG
tara:strand:- start:1029 stop:1139 length:111 start_codon:yes stop_codon:yes gene_type:complete